MLLQQLQQRRASHGAASTSASGSNSSGSSGAGAGRCRRAVFAAAVPRSSKHPAAAPPPAAAAMTSAPTAAAAFHRRHAASNTRCSTRAAAAGRRPRSSAAAAAPDDDDDAADAANEDAAGELELQPAASAAALQQQQGASPYDNMQFAATVNLDFDEEGAWAKQVADWEAFWYERQDDEIMEWEEEAYEGLSALERSQAAVARAQALASQIRDLRKRSDVERMITPDDRVTTDYADTYTTEEELVSQQTFHRPDPNPTYDALDLRALAEKRAQRGALDAEWKRRDALLARPYSFTLRLDHDARLAGAEFDWIREEWTEEQIQDLIIGGGQFVAPDKIPVTVLNPLLPMDFHNDVGVHLVPETEEFIEAIGHMATEADLQYLQTSEEIALHGKDFVDPSVMFEAPDGAVYAEAPANPWAEARKLRDAEDLSLFEAVVERVSQRSRAAYGDAASAQQQDGDAAAADGDDSSSTNSSAQVWYDSPRDAAADDVMGAGFSAFMAGMDEPGDSPACLMTAEELVGRGLAEADQLSRDEGEESDGDDAPEGEGRIPGTDELDQ